MNAALPLSPHLKMMRYFNDIASSPELRIVASYGGTGARRGDIGYS